ncbi:hypothetical protein DPMN_113126 [Dreissena polymorpha]|uniref:Uncharacterized protein n=1 Tax=Dreissena polymorpha TaxID=45954 RepID=A0A9D4KGZ6_DREPO|nr:hypothetical protein DPMN_113126 [Dreissena polymorpha]
MAVVWTTVIRETLLETLGDKVISSDSNSELGRYYWPRTGETIELKENNSHSLNLRSAFHFV